MSNSEDLYGVSWSNPAWSHFLCSANILDYFCDLSNPFYDRQCNNEVIRMQRLHPEQLLSMTGVEFYLHHAQEPILFVIRKQQRLSPTQVTPLAYYYIINGTVLQSPDLLALLNSRLLTTVVGLKKLLQTLSSCSRYHPSDGSYSWDDPNTLLGLESSVEQSDYHQQRGGGNSSIGGGGGGSSSSTSSSNRPQMGNLFQVQRTDLLLADWMSRFPMPSETNFMQTGASNQMAASTSTLAISSANATTTTTTATITMKEEDTNKNVASSAKMSSRMPNLPGVGVVSGSTPMCTPSQPPSTDRKLRI